MASTTHTSLDTISFEFISLMLAWMDSPNAVKHLCSMQVHMEYRSKFLLFNDSCETHLLAIWTDIQLVELQRFACIRYSYISRYRILTCYICKELYRYTNLFHIVSQSSCQGSKTANWRNLGWKFAIHKGWTECIAPWYSHISCVKNLSSCEENTHLTVSNPYQSHIFWVVLLYLENNGETVKHVCLFI